MSTDALCSLYKIERDIHTEESNALLEDIQVFHLRIMDVIMEDTKSASYLEPGQEGFFGSVTDFISTCLRAVGTFVERVVSWFTGKIKHLIHNRVRAKKRNDTRYANLVTMYNSLTAQQKAQAEQKFAEFTIEHCPTQHVYLEMCDDFLKIAGYLERNVTAYVSRDISSFGAEVEERAYPEWIIPDLVQVLLKFNIAIGEGEVTYSSPFSGLGRMRFTDGGYSINSVNVIHTNYTQKVFAKLAFLQGMEKQFKALEETIKAKRREVKRTSTKEDKNIFKQATAQITSSISIAVRLSNYLCNIEEAMDVRRGWVIGSAISACTAVLGPKVTEE